MSNNSAEQASLFPTAHFALATGIYNLRLSAADNFFFSLNRIELTTDSWGSSTTTIATTSNVNLLSF
jgi:hypothetical protein